MNKRGFCPIYLRLSISNEIRCEVSTGIFIPIDQWDEQRRLAKDNYLSTNERLNTILQKAYSEIAKNEREDKVSLRAVADVLKGKKRSYKETRLDKVLDEYIEITLPANSTVRRLKRCLTLFVNHTKNIPIADVVEQHITGFSQNLLLKQNYSTLSVNKFISQLKGFFSYALNQGYCTKNPCLFHRKIKNTKLELVQLTTDEVERLQKRIYHENRLTQIRDLFLFQCYTGLAYADLANFSRANVVLEKGVLFLRGERQKTGQFYFLPYLPEARKIAENYDYILPVISNQKYNKHLKTVIEIAEIKKSVGTHVGRKTFAQIMIDKQYSLESVAKMLGHSSFKMTQQHYARVGETRVYNEYMSIETPTQIQFSQITQEPVQNTMQYL